LALLTPPKRLKILRLTLRISPVGSRSASASLTPPKRLKILRLTLRISPVGFPLGLGLAHAAKTAQIVKDLCGRQLPLALGRWRAFPDDGESGPGQNL